MSNNDYAQLGELRKQQAIAGGEKEAVRILREKAAEYERLQAALARLQGLDCFVEVWLGEKSFFITIYDPQYTTTETCGGVGATLLEACEAALAAYDALSENER